jgi:hypothetical protein
MRYMRTALTLAGGLAAVGIITAAPASAQPDSTVSCSDPCRITDPGYFPTLVNTWLELPGTYAGLPGTWAENAASLPERWAENFNDFTGGLLGDQEAEAEE